MGRLRQHLCIGCILVLAGGVDRWAVPPGSLGIHRPYFEPKLFAGLSYGESQKKYNDLAAGVRAYLAEMGIPDDVFQLMLRTPSNEMKFLDSDEAETLGLLGKDPAHEEWERARATQRHGAPFMKSMDALIKCVNEGGTDRKCSRILKPSEER